MIPTLKILDKESIYMYIRTLNLTTVATGFNSPTWIVALSNSLLDISEPNFIRCKYIQRNCCFCYLYCFNNHSLPSLRVKIFNNITTKTTKRLKQHDSVTSRVHCGMITFLRHAFFFVQIFSRRSHSDIDSLFLVHICGLCMINKMAEASCSNDM
jgi:hypothetical protein